MTQYNLPELLTKVRDEASSAPNDVRMVRVLNVGEASVRQGDILIWAIKEVPVGAVRRQSHQLALGDTLGSRHLAPPEAEVYDLPENMRQVGLNAIFRLRERGTVTHPQHAHISLPSGCYMAGSEIDPKTRRAVQD